tara:strand:- start:2583 stop:3608 length:1026 start_codon:yes stop_codon:yes gene_type:complete
MKVLVTGGAGYIGSHAVVALLEAGHEVVVLDDLSNGNKLAVERAANLADASIPPFIEGDIRDRALLDEIFASHRIDAVMHFAGVKAVGESVEQPLKYFDINVGGSVTLLQAMYAADVSRIIFSSSATVYGDKHPMPLHEGLPTGEPANPYGRSKLMVEHALADVAIAQPAMSVGILRYFNPVGAHASGLIGEAPQGWPNNLVPFVSQVAIGQRESLAVFGNDYPTPDGTGVRDYIHVLDLVEGHLAALEALNTEPGLNIWNLGTGNGHSVLDVVHAFERVSERRVPYHVAPRRSGDAAQCWANSYKAFSDLGWRATRGLDEMLADTWRWQVRNPNGYEPEN